MFDPLDPRFLRFNRIVCTGTGHDTFHVQRVGSGFVVAFAHEFFLFTSRHGIINAHADPTRLIIPITWDDHRPWPVKEFSLPEPSERFNRDEAYADVAIFWLDSEAIKGVAFNDNDFLPLRDPCISEKGHPLFAFGFPDSPGTFIDFDSKNVYGDLTPILGEYGGRTKDIGLHFFKSENLNGIEPNGFSGGPVTTLDPTQVGRHLLAGLILRGGKGSGMLRYLGREMIADLIREVLPNLGSASKAHQSIEN